MLFGSGGVGETMGSSFFFAFKYNIFWFFFWIQTNYTEAESNKINVNVLFVKLMYIKRA